LNICRQGPGKISSSIIIRLRVRKLRKTYCWQWPTINVERYCDEHQAKYRRQTAFEFRAAGDASDLRFRIQTHRVFIIFDDSFRIDTPFLSYKITDDCKVIFRSSFLGVYTGNKYCQERIINSDATKVKSLIWNLFFSPITAFQTGFKSYKVLISRIITGIQWIFGLNFFRPVIWL